MSARGSASWLVLLALCGLCLAAPAAAQDDSSDELKDVASDDAPSTDAPPKDSTDAAPDAAPASSSDQTPASVQPAAPLLRVEPFLGLGFGTRAFERPTTLAGQRLPTAFFPAVELGLRVVAWPERRFSLAVLVRYQSSVGLKVEERPPFALPNEISVRAERGELSAAPTYRFGETKTAPSLAFPLGIGVRTLWPAVHESMTPGYSLIGPMLRAELNLPLGDLLLLRFGPELQWIVAMDRQLHRNGVANQGAAMGGEAMAQVALGPTFALALCYRESHAVASSINGGPIFNDIERFLTLRLSGAL
jgi:hypothetical protein